MNKIYVKIGNNPDLDKYVQNAVFKAGGRWSNGIKEYTPYSKEYGEEYCINISNINGLCCAGEDYYKHQYFRVDLNCFLKSIGAKPFLKKKNIG